MVDINVENLNDILKFYSYTELGTEYYEAFEPDVLLSHNDVIELENTIILCNYAPGHTPGTKAFFFGVTDGKTTLRAAMYGGVGMNSKH